ncbi:hypothetical protein SCG7109_AR_00010, partial [Chlamydiales bacterium SCGC AG-110-M15]
MTVKELTPRTRIQQFYKKTLYHPLKKIEQSLQHLLLSTTKKIIPTFNSFKRFGIVHHWIHRQNFPNKQFYPKEQILRPLPKKVQNKALHPLFLREENVTIPEACIHTIKDGIITEKAAHISPRGELIYELSEEFTAEAPNQHSLFTYKKSRLPIIPKKIDGIVASLVASSHDNYYHWLFDVLPRFHLLQQSDFDVDYYYVSQKMG